MYRRFDTGFKSNSFLNAIDRWTSSKFATDGASLDFHGAFGNTGNAQPVAGFTTNIQTN